MEVSKNEWQTPPPDSQKPVLDREQLDAATGGDIEFQGELLEAYLESCGVLRLKIDNAIDGLDLPALHALAHSLKGSSMSVGATQVAESAEVLEHAAKASNADQCVWIMIRLRKALDAVTIEIQAMPLAA